MVHGSQAITRIQVQTAQAAAQLPIHQYQGAASDLLHPSIQAEAEMQRINLNPRDDWKEKVESEGLSFHTIDGEIYWDESACYRFTLSQIDKIEDATNELHGMCMQAIDYVIRTNLFSKLQIPEKFVPLIRKSWETKEPSMYGRFDFCYDGSGEPKLLEYNADTPTSLLEASVIQWFWMKDVFPDADQFNSIHEKLIEYWKRTRPFAGLVHFACVKDNEEDLGTIEYIRDVAIQTGCETRQLFVDDIGWDSDADQFVDLDNAPIKTMFKLYPWEWMFEEEFGDNIIKTNWRLIEPPWKSILSNKGILPILWDMFPHHKNLLPSYFDNRFTDNYVKKPLFSREGNNVTIYKNGTVTEKDGTYGKEGYIFQEYSPMPSFNGNSVSIGSWVVDGMSAGMGIREDSTEITTNTGRFVPHYFEED
jgi:glutathionylspermidine synthase